jgi:hypothetical protein
VAAFLVGAIAALLPRPPLYIACVVFAFAVAAELFQWRSDVEKSGSEALLRKLDLCRSFNMEITEADKRDIVWELPRALRKRFTESQVPDTYFTSSEPSGPRKAIENLVESAWYTRQQSKLMLRVWIGLICVAVVFAFTALIVASIEVSSVTARASIGKVVTAWLLLIFSLGAIRHPWNYYKLLERSERSYTTGSHLLRGEVTEADAIKQWYEYQIGRASSPLLPDWLWKRNQADLNDAWRLTSST